MNRTMRLRQWRRPSVTIFREHVYILLQLQWFHRPSFHIGPCRVPSLALTFGLQYLQNHIFMSCTPLLDCLFINSTTKAPFRFLIVRRKVKLVAWIRRLPCVRGSTILYAVIVVCVGSCTTRLRPFAVLLRGVYLRASFTSVFWWRYFGTNTKILDLATKK